MTRTTASWAAAVVVLASAAWANTGPYKWATVPVPYRVYGHTSIPGVPDFLDAGVRAVQRAFDAWTPRGSVPVTCTSWATSYAGTFTTPSGPSASVPSDDLNSVVWLSGNAWTHGANTLVWHAVSYSVSTQQLRDIDVELNANYQWAAGNPAGSQYDIESVLITRAGYFFGAQPSPGVSTSLLNGQNFQLGVTRSTLGPSDVSDVCTMYPSDGGVVFPPTHDAGVRGEFCRFCRVDADCTSGLCVTVDGRYRSCSASCTTSNDCGAGFSCLNNARGSVCVSQTPCTGQCGGVGGSCGQGFTCSAGRCEATGAVGEACDVTSYCEPCAVCVFDGQATRCARCCNAQGSCSSCASPSGCTTQQTCAALGSGAQVCVARDAGVVVDAGTGGSGGGGGGGSGGSGGTGGGGGAGGSSGTGGAAGGGGVAGAGGTAGAGGSAGAGGDEDAGASGGAGASDAGTTARRDAGSPGSLPPLPDSCGCDAGAGSFVAFGLMLVRLVGARRRRRGR